MIGTRLRRAGYLAAAVLLTSCSGSASSSEGARTSAVPLDDNGSFDGPVDTSDDVSPQLSFADVSLDALCAALSATTTADTLGMPVVGEPERGQSEGVAECRVKTEVITTSVDSHSGGSTAAPNEAIFLAAAPGWNGTADDLERMLLDGSDCPGGVAQADGATGSYRWAQAWCAGEIGGHYAVRFLFFQDFAVSYAISRAQSLGEYDLSDLSVDADTAFGSLLSSIG